MDVDQLIAMHRSKEDAFVAAAENSRLDVLKALLSQGVDVNCRDSRFGNSALHRAAANGSVKTVTFLLECGADINSLDGNDLTALAVACSTGKKKGSAVALTLLQRGADATYVRVADGMTAYGFALWGQCSPEVLDALKMAGGTPPEPGFKVVRLV
jgi:ankyrin repeat protein